MIQRSSKSVQKEYIAKVILTTVFLGGFAIFIGWMMIFGPGLNVFKLSAMDLVLLAFSTYRLGRLIAYDRVMEPFRQFFTNTVPDPTGAGESVDPKGEGFQQSIGQLICCPICAGTWVAALLTYALYLFPGPARVFLTMTAVIGIAELLGATTEALSWGGQYARTKSGEINLEHRSRAKSYPERMDYPERVERIEQKEHHSGEADSIFESYREHR